MTNTSAAPKKIGHIDRDTLRYHGEAPFSAWGKVWKRVMTHLPVDAAYAIYDHYIRKTGVLPVPPLSFVQWEHNQFRIMKTEDGGESVLALYKTHDQFVLIKATKETYETWAAKKDAVSLQYSKED